MNKSLLLVPAAVAALVVPAWASATGEATPAEPVVAREQVVAAVAASQAVVEPAHAPARTTPVSGTVAKADRMSGTLARLNPERISPRIAENLLAR
jgi:hypothetical protein